MQKPRIVDRRYYYWVHVWYIYWKILHPQTGTGEKMCASDLWSGIVRMVVFVCVWVCNCFFFRGLGWISGNNYLLSHKFLINLSQYSELRDREHVCRCWWWWYCRKCNVHTRKRKRNKMATNVHRNAHMFIIFWLDRSGLQNGGTVIYVAAGTRVYIWYIYRLECIEESLYAYFRKSKSGGRAYIPYSHHRAWQHQKPCYGTLYAVLAACVFVTPLWKTLKTEETKSNLYIMNTRAAWTPPFPVCRSLSALTAHKWGWETEKPATNIDLPSQIPQQQQHCCDLCDAWGACV